jgi:hypothetical protein
MVGRHDDDRSGAGPLGMLRKLDHLVGAGQADMREDGYPAARGADGALDQALALREAQVE